MPDADAIAALRAALAVSPDNTPLRRHLADTLMGLGRFAEAEAEYRTAVAATPNDAGLQLALARCFQKQDKLSAALVIAEDLGRRDRPDPAACILLARLLLASGDVPGAVVAYRRAVELDPDAKDAGLATTLGVRDTPETVRIPGFLDDTTPEFDEIVDGRLRQADGTGERGERVRPEKPNVKFSDVGGMNGVKEEVRKKIIFPLTHPELYKAYGKKTGGGILMYGPPGCGKTHLARATAGEIDGGFLSVGISDVLDMWIGQSERNLHEIFESARRDTPCVLFFDEVDALGASRSDMRGSAGRQVINQFLAELDGVDTSNDGVLVLAATNAPWHLDSAFRRPGRFDRVIFVPPPDEPARADILRLLLADKPTDRVDAEKIAAKTDGFSGADLKGLVDVAVEGKLDEAMATGRPVPLVTKDLLAAAKSMRPSTQEWFNTAKNYAMFANQGGIYDDIVRYLKLK